MIPVLCVFVFVASINLLTQSEDFLFYVKVRRLSKILLMPSLGLFYFVASEKPSFLILVALGFGCIGDILLRGFLKVETNKTYTISEPEWSFLMGLCAFLIGHLAYVLFFVKTVQWEKTDILFFSFMIIILWYGMIVLKGVRPKGLMLLGVMVYMLVIASMIICALAMYYTNRDLPSFYVAIGAILFGSSDSVLAFRQIKNIRSLPTSYIMFSYISGQFLIILGII